jgi:dihydropteroate synthase
MPNYSTQIVYIPNLSVAKEEIAKIGTDPGGVLRMAPKAVHFCIKVEHLRSKACNILKQEMLSLGGDAAVHKHVVDAGVESSDVLLMGTVKQYRLLIPKLKAQPFGLAKLAEDIKEILASQEVRGE